MLAGSARTCTPDAVTPGEASPAAAQAAGLEMPALDRAAAIFCCCVMSTALSGADAVDRWIMFGPVGEIRSAREFASESLPREVKVSRRALIETEKPPEEEVHSMASSSCT